MATLRNVACQENEGLAMFLFHKWQQMADNANANDKDKDKHKFSDRLDATLSKAYMHLCLHTQPILTLRDASQIKGIGNWTLNILKDYFKSAEDVVISSKEGQEDTGEKMNKGTRRYLPQRGSAPYAILISLYMGTRKDKQFMLKQEVIDAAEVSGLSRMPIGPSKTGASFGSFGKSSKDWYCGWSSMKTLINKGLVVKSSCPAKYMLTEEGVRTAVDCGQRSGLDVEIDSSTENQHISNPDVSGQIPDDSVVSSSCHGQSTNIAATENTGRSRIKLCNTIQISESSKGHGRISCKEAGKHLGEISSCSSQDPMDSLPRDDSQNALGGYGDPKIDLCNGIFEEQILRWNKKSSTIKACTVFDLQCGSSKYLENESGENDSLYTNVLAVPPLENDTSFTDLYDVILILDDREQFGHDSRGNNTRHKVSEQLQSQFHIQVQVRRLPIGDAIWIAWDKHCGHEYVLDFIIERKKVNDLSHSIRDNRYKDQKLRLLRCGIQRLIYLIEGDMNLIEASESVKSAAFTSEILEGFDVQRTRDLAGTIRKYGNLTLAIIDVYKKAASGSQDKWNKLCMSFNEFVQKCHELEKETISDVFGVQLMQVPLVTEDVALTILDHYPTVVSLARAYALLEGDRNAQESLLEGIPIRNKNKTIGDKISKNVYTLIWGL